MSMGSNWQLAIRAISGLNVIFLYLVIPNCVSEARVFFSAQVGVRDLLFLFEVYGICEIDIAKEGRSRINA